nr:RNA-directed DNA polymerase, eukaryota [Tanacetum cinerariifolium]
MVYTSDEDSDVGPQKVPDRSQFREEGPNNDRVSDVEEVSETNFGDNSSIPINHIDELEKQQSEDPFNIYRLLRKQPGDESHEVSSSLSHPPGFTPNVSVIRNENSQSANEILVVVNAKVMNNSQDVYKEASCDNVDPNVFKKGGSVLGVMEDMIRVGKAMGYSMDGLGHKTKKEWIKELTSKNKINFMAIQETKTHCVNHMDAKFMWGNSNYNYVYSEAVGNSGGILCVWEATVFKKDYATISDNFVAIYWTWFPSNSKVLFVAIYAPQQVVVLGDFNKVRNIDERRGFCFNPTSARVFDQFISASGLVDVKIEGYTFTWSHPSGSKMSKLDRFLVSEGIFSIFPSIAAVYLDRHLSDHRLIILCEDLKVRIRAWIKDKRSIVSGEKDSIKKELSDIDRLLDGGDVSDSNLLRRSELHHNLYNINQMESKEVNLSRRGILLESSSCPLCLSSEENIHHVLFGCGLAESIFRRICRWWELDWQALESFSDWNYWFSLIRLSSKVNALLEDVFGVAWWSIWGFRNRTIYNEMPPRRSALFDDIIQYKDAKTLFEAIQARLGGNDATKKTQRTLLKKMYENFNAHSTESLNSIFNKLQKIVSQLAILGENISQEHLNMKFLRSLPSEWNTRVVVWRNKADLDTISIKDLYTRSQKNGYLKSNTPIKSQRSGISIWGASS